MINIYTAAQAERAILRRDRALEPEVPPGMRAAMLRLFKEPLSPEAAVRRILQDIRQRGDTALWEWTARIDNVRLDSLFVAPEEISAAASRLPTDLLDALSLAVGRIRAFHQQQPIRSWMSEDGQLGQRIVPLQRVGVYVPGGTAPLPSSLLMSAIPAQVAGVPEIIVATPPGKDGRVPEVILAAAHLIGLETILPLGGAQAIGAMAFGTESVPRVDKIVGPGNLFVTLAKQQVYGMVGIDGLYGPTETVVIADETANPAWVAADLLAQAEHDELATAILFTPSPSLAEAVQVEVARQLEQLPRAEVIAAALTHQGGIVLTESVAQAAELASAFAPEHLCLATANPQEWVGHIHNAGGIFLGERSFEVLGDYVAGPSHVMPTSGTARFASPLSVVDFVKIISLINLSAESSAQLCGPAERLAHAEGLAGHGLAARKRVETGDVGDRFILPNS